jgi:spore germination cell wall hydrolase CwlJ-like protein
VKIELTIDTKQLGFDTNRLQWVGGLGIILACASCVPSPHSAGVLAPSAALAAVMQPAEQLDPAAREQVSRKAAEWLVPVSNDPAEPFLDSGQSGEDHEPSLDCLTAAIYYEARSEPEDGQRAVAQVVLNRVRHPAFPSTVCGVVFQGHERSTGCQFSFTCDGSMTRGRRDSASWMRARRFAKEALDGYVFAPVGNATHYHTTAIRPYWAAYLRQSATVGSHIFYRWAGNAGEASAFRQTYGGLEPVPALLQNGGASDVTIHRGMTPEDEQAASKWREEIALDDGGSVTIHRGGASALEHRAAAPEIEVPHEAPPPRQTAQEAAAVGVKVHVGTPPSIG